MKTGGYEPGALGAFLDAENPTTVKKRKVRPKPDLDTSNGEGTTVVKGKGKRKTGGSNESLNAKKTTVMKNERKEEQSNPESCLIDTSLDVCDATIKKKYRTRENSGGFDVPLKRKHKDVRKTIKTGLLDFSLNTEDITSAKEKHEKEKGFVESDTHFNAEDMTAAQQKRNKKRKNAESDKQSAFLSADETTLVQKKRKKEGKTVDETQSVDTQEVLHTADDGEVQPKNSGVDTDMSNANASKDLQEESERKMKVDEKLRTIFVGNVPLTSTRKDMKKLFSKFGQVESVRLRSVVPDSQKTSKKVAVLKNSFSEKMRSLIFYVKFKEKESAQKALLMNGEKLGENTIKVDGCCGRRTYSGQTSVFVGNLPYDVQDDELSAHFKKSGDILSVRIIRDPSSGVGKGFGFVVFKDSSSVPLALKMDNSVFKERQLRVTRVQKKKKAKEHAKITSVRRTMPTRKNQITQRAYRQVAGSKGNNSIKQRKRFAKARKKSVMS